MDTPRHWLGNMTVRDVLEVIVVIGLGIGFLLSQTANSSSQATQLATLNKSVEVLTAKVDSLNNAQQRVSIVEDRVKENAQRIDRMEAAIYGPQGLNEKFTDVQSKLQVIADLLQGKKQR